MRKWLGRRGQQGLSVLQRELELEDRSGFREMLRMISDEFDVLLEMVGPLITRQGTKMRMTITARERLSLTLRFLATGETYKSLSFQYRIGATTISTIVKETCETLHQVLKNEFLKSGASVTDVGSSPPAACIWEIKMGTTKSTLEKHGYVLQKTTGNYVVATKGDDTSHKRDQVASDIHKYSINPRDRAPDEHKPSSHCEPQELFQRTCSSPKLERCAWADLEISMKIQQHQ
ncbi:uncharacterized protein LOC125894606 isoform X3 [Epinephelus fuscoguttatus]|uniref:uncharacterized protein LOC125894606 isoform X3 n=1 Tax=Epinephelus fuscoguttatus TaxID=293821 RepID=UPI0020D0752A|nr:uncharacterized protein LOC125894606 isoform X3 [Epinephelus fuscoguttatus]